MIHIGSLIEQELRRQDRYVTWLASELHCDRTNQKFMVGVGYSQDLSNITDNTKFHSFDISLGICF